LGWSNAQNVIVLCIIQDIINDRYSDFRERKFFSFWGNEKNTSQINNPWQYSSKRIDEETGLIYFGRRYYDPSLGRWLTPDPKGFIDGLNLYAYVLNDPLINSDLYGLSFNDALKGAATGTWNFLTKTVTSLSESNDDFIHWDTAQLPDGQIKDYLNNNNLGSLKVFSYYNSIIKGFKWCF